MHLQFPVLIEHLKEENSSAYRAAPLFMPHPEVEHQRYDQCIRGLKSAVRKQLKHQKINRENMDLLLWYQFQPGYRFKVETFEFIIGRRNYRGHFSYALVPVKHLLFILLPGFNRYLYLAADTSATFDEKEEVQQLLLHMLKIRYNSDRQGFDINDYTSHKSDYVTYVQMEVQIPNAPLSFAHRVPGDFMAALYNPQEFHGGTEIRRVAIDLSEKYPLQSQASTL